MLVHEACSILKLDASLVFVHFISVYCTCTSRLAVSSSQFYKRKHSQVYYHSTSIRTIKCMLTWNLVTSAHLSIMKQVHSVLVCDLPSHPTQTQLGQNCSVCLIHVWCSVIDSWLALKHSCSICENIFFVYGKQWFYYYWTVISNRKRGANAGT